MATSESKPKAPSVSLYDMLEKRYEEQQGWLLFYEVANGTGYKGTGYADALAMSVWPSRGISLHGFEIKRSRTDLLKELRDKGKAENFLKYCNHWWLVVDDAKLVDGVEIPATWGILAPRQNVLYQLRAAPKLEPEQWKPEFIAAMMRRFYEAHIKKDTSAIQEHVRTRAQQLAKTLASQQLDRKIAAAEREAQMARDRAEQLARQINDFQEASGISVSPWNAKNIGDAVRLVLDGARHPDLRRQLQSAKDITDRIAKSLGGALKNLEQLEQSNSS